MAELQSLQDLAPQAAAAAAPVYVQKLDAQGRAYATGKRKNAVARVWISRGAGKIIINEKDFTRLFRAAGPADGGAAADPRRHPQRPV